MPAVFGIDISDESTSVTCDKSEIAVKFPTAVVKDKDSDKWLVGEKAYARVLDNKALKTDKLYTLMLMDGSATIYEVKYSALELMKIFLKEALDEASRILDTGDYPEHIVISIPRIDEKMIEKFMLCFSQLGYDRDKVNIISRCESFIFYVMSKGKDIWNNQVGMFYLADSSLSYFELRVQRSARSMAVYSESKEMDERFNLSIINSNSGSRMADRILTSCAERMLGKKVFSTIFLTGKGFEETDWAESFIKYICSRRKVFADEDLFAKGACIRGVDLSSKKPLFNFKCICDGRLDTDISLCLTKKDTEYNYEIASAGDLWYGTAISLRLIADGNQELEFLLSPVDIYKNARTIKIPLDFMPKRPLKTVRLDIEIKFKDSMTMVLNMKDAGFGEIYKALPEAVFNQEVSLWD